MTANEAEALAGGASGERTGRNPGMALAGAEADTAYCEQPKSEKDWLMSQVVERANMQRAYSRVMKNRGAPGVDGMRCEDLKAWLQANWAQVRRTLLDGSYRPQAVRRVDIPKPQGGVRTLGVPTVVDRLIQQALHQAMQPLFEPTFSDGSYGFRPGRSAQQAVVKAAEYIRTGKRWVVDMDLEKFFDRVNHDVLMARVTRQVSDTRVLRLIRAAQAGWDAERIEADTLNKQMADAYEVQAAELEAAQGEIAQIRTDAGLLAVDVKERQAELSELKLKLTAATAATETADARTVEIERRAADLRIELDHGHQEAAQSRAELVGVRQTHTAEVEVLRAELTASQGKAEGAAEKAATTTDALRTELATVKAKAEAAQDTHQEHRKLVAAEAHRAAERLTTTQAERDQAQKDAGKAREEAAALRGQVDAIKEQNAQLLQTLKIQSEKQPSKDKRD